MRRCDGDSLRFLARLVRHDGLGGDLLGGIQVFLHQQRREREHVADVVEPVAHVVGGEIGGGVELDAQQVANGIGVLGTVETPDRHPPRIGASRPGRLDRGSASSQAVTASYSSSLGRRLSSGGILRAGAWRALAPRRRDPPTRPQRCGTCPTGHLVSASAPLWQSRQYRLRNGRTATSNDCGPAAGGLAGSAAKTTAQNPAEIPTATSDHTRTCIVQAPRGEEDRDRGAKSRRERQSLGCRHYTQAGNWRKRTRRFTRIFVYALRLGAFAKEPSS